MTGISALRGTYGAKWIIEESADGFYAVRKRNLSTEDKARGLSAVRCGATLDELALHLAEEVRLQQRHVPLSPAQPSAFPTSAAERPPKT
jgi:hypothetical protein